MSGRPRRADHPLAARYQHVTDTLRSQVASEVGELIWSPATASTPGQVSVDPEALAMVLGFARQRLAERESDPAANQIAAAIDQLQTILQAADGQPRDSK